MENKNYITHKSGRFNTQHATAGESLHEANKLLCDARLLLQSLEYENEFEEAAFAEKDANLIKYLGEAIQRIDRKINRGDCGRFFRK